MNEPDYNEIQKERRNLILLSLLLIINFFSEIDLEKISVFGLEEVFANPIIIYWLLVLTWFYFFIRFYQAVVSGRKFSSIIESYKSYLSRLSEKPIKATLKKRGMEEPFGKSYINYYKLEKANWYTFLYGFGEANNITGKYEITRKEKIYIYTFLFSYLKSFLHVIFNTRKVTEYILPFVIAGFAIILLSLEFYSFLVN